MPPIAKVHDVVNSSTETAARPVASVGANEEGGSRAPQPVALEVPVTVNGARAVEGSDKREPFSESTKTVLVFGNGAVIRLTSSVAPGQLLFLTNEKTKKEVVCQVVKSKNYRNVSGYVELEFTEAVVGFWGLRFPSDRIGPQSTPSAAPAAGAPANPTIAPPAIVPPAAMVKLMSPMNPAPAKPGATSSVPAQPKMPLPAAPTTVSSSTPPSSSSEALKLEAARLQEQLSSMLFLDQAAAKQVPLADKKVTGVDAAAKILELAKEIPTATVAAPLKTAAPSFKSVLESEEVRIPSWLEPLARNAAATQPPTQEVAPKHESHEAHLEQVAEHNEHQDSAASATYAADAGASESSGSLFGNILANEEISLNEEISAPQKASGGSNKGLLIGAIAAGLLVLAGGSWFLRRPSISASGTASLPSTTANSLPAASAPSPSPAQTTASLPSASGSSVLPAPKPSASSIPFSSSQPHPQSAVATGQVPRTITNANSLADQPRTLRTAEPEPKKPALGAVHLAAPKVARRASAKDNVDAEPAINVSAGQVANGADAFAGGLAGDRANQPEAPAAPIAVGGDVKAARLLSSIHPIYPILAKNQHIAGDVRVDALIDSNGRVSSMKVVSGPTLLHQAAMDALRQWKYQPATLDGKPVSMHLTVTVQFRLQ